MASDWGSLGLWAELALLERKLPLLYPLEMRVVEEHVAPSYWLCGERRLHIVLPGSLDIASALALSLRFFIYARAMTHACSPRFSRGDYAQALAEVAKLLELPDESTMRLRDGYELFRSPEQNGGGTMH